MAGRAVHRSSASCRDGPPRSGLLGHTLNMGLGAGVEGGVLSQFLLNRGEQEGLLFVAGVVQNSDVLLGLATQHQTSGIAAVVQDHVGGSAVAPLKNTVIQYSCGFHL